MTIKFEDVLREIDGFGKYQKTRYVLICLAALLPSIATYINSFTAALPEFKCNNHGENELPSLKKPINLNCVYHSNGTLQKCTSWTFEKKYFQSTLTEEWNMVCDRSIFRSKVQSIYFIGYLVGSLVLGNLSDRYGRRPVMLLSFGLMLIGFFGSTFGPQKFFGFTISYILYAISRFLIACGTRGINETGYVLALELVGTKMRTYAGIGFENFFSLGQLILVLIAYFVRDWRQLSLTFTVFIIPFLSYFFLLPESPRWLLSKNKHEKAFEMLEQVAKTNQRTLSKSTWNQFLNQCKIGQERETIITLFKSFFRCPNLAVIFFTMIFNWFVNNFVFYGVGLKSIDLGINPYLSFSISASVEILAYLSALLVIQKFGRKKPYFLFLLVAGFSCLSHVFINDLTMNVAMAMLGKLCVSASYSILRLYTNELFPTSVRSSCIGVCSMVSRIGVILSPIINSLGDDWKPMPFLVYGVLAVSGACSTFILPETLNRKLPETINDVQNFKIKSNKLNLKKQESVEKKLIDETLS